MNTASPTLIEMIAQLVATPSVSSVDATQDMPNRPVVDLLCGWLEDAGFAIDQVPVPGQDGKTNLIATLGSGTGGLVLAGHTDTVPYDEHGWSSNPFALREADGKLYGLGTCDMKGFLALAVEAARDYRAQDLHTPLTILATADEETSMSGAKALAAAGKPRARHALIGEPTSMRPVRMHKGMMMDAVHVHGQSGHSSNPDFGASALEGMHLVIAELIQWREELANAHQIEGFEPPYPTMNLGYIRGGDNPNRICGDCELGIDLRPLPGMDRAQLRDTLHQRVRGIFENSKLSVEFDVLFDGADPMYTPANADIVRFAEKLTGESASAVAFSTEAPYLTGLGMDTIVLGPGNIEQAHQPDEYLAVDRINPMRNLLNELIKRYCLA